MVAVAKGGTFQFTLSSTGSLLPVISNCVTKVKATGVSNAGDFTIASPPKPPVVAQKACRSQHTGRSLRQRKTY